MNTDDRIFSAWSEVSKDACRRLPGGVILPEDQPGLYRRVARNCGVTVEAVRKAVEVPNADRN